MLRNRSLHRRSLAMELSSSSPPSLEAMVSFSAFSAYLWRAMTPSSSVLASSSCSQFAQPEKEEHPTWEQTLGVLGRPPSPSTYACLLRSCIQNTALAHGRLTHELIIISGFDQLPFLQFLLLQMYNHFAAVEDAFKMFLSVHQKDVALWNMHIEALQAEEARCLYRRMQEEGVIPTRTTYMILLSVLDGHESLLEGKHIHVLTIEIECKEDVYVGTTLVNMYGKCGGLAESRATFDAMPARNVISWTAMISVFAQHFEGEDAFHFFEKMLQERVNPDRVTFVNVITGCASQFMLEEGQFLHTWILYYGLEKHVSIVNALINLYGKCGAWGEAQLVFDSIQVRDMISFSSLISAHAGHRKFSEALSLFHEMELAGFSPNKIALLNVLSVFACQEALKAGQDVHKSVVGKGFDGDLLVCNALINMYHKCGCAESARVVFHNMPDRNVISWTSIIGMHAQEGRHAEVFQAFEGMQREGLTPNRVTFVSMVELCASSQVALAEGHCVHACIVANSGFELGLVLGTSLIKMYGLHGSLEDAQDVFDRSMERDVLTWNSIITVYIDHGFDKKALELVAIMMGEGTLPDDATYGLLLVACSVKGALCFGKETHARAQGSDVVMNVVTATNIVNMYGKCGSLSQSYRLFDRMRLKNVISWTTMISSYMESGLDEMALQLFEQMFQECVFPNMVTFVNIVTICANQLALAGGKRLHAYILHSDFRFDIELGNALISMYGKCEALKHARQTFDNMLGKNVVSWSGMIAAYAQHSHGMAALQLFEEMQLIGVLPNDVTLVSVLDACISQTCLAAGECLHVFLLNNTLELSVLVGNSMVNMYNKCGNIRDAWKTFSSMKEKDSTTWSVMIGACAEHGQGKEVVRLIEQMMHKGLAPDEAAIVNLLSACSHCGLLNAGWHAFISLIQNFCLTPDHCACIIDMFCRAGDPETAEFLIDCVPVHPTLMSFVALLGSCRYQGDVTRGVRMAGRVHELDAKQTALVYILNHIYSAACSVGNGVSAVFR